MDLVLSLARGGEPYPANCRLLEVGQALVRGDAKRRIFVWSTGRIGAAIEGDRILIDRRLGRVGDGPVALSRHELAALSAACRDWERKRDDWAAFWASGAGYPAGFGGAWYFQPPGKDAKEVKVGSRCAGRKEGHDFAGRDDTRPIPEPIVVAIGVEIVAERWRLGEQYGDPKGERTGFVYRLADTARLEAERHGAVLRKGPSFIGIEPGRDERFVEELLEAVER